MCRKTFQSSGVCLNLDFYMFKYCRHLQNPRKVHQCNQAKTGSWKTTCLLLVIYSHSSMYRLAQTGGGTVPCNSSLCTELQTGSGVSLCCVVTLIIGVCSAGLHASQRRPSTVYQEAYMHITVSFQSPCKV